MGRRALVLVVALVLAGVAAFSIFQYLTNYENEILAGQEQVRVFRAVQPLQEGTEGNFVLQNRGILYTPSVEQRQDLPTDAITATSEDDFSQLEQVLRGRVAAGPISGNSILTASQWVELTVSITPLAELISEGYQAITVSPGQIQGVNGFVQPGDRINAILTVDIDFTLTALAEQAPDFGIPVETDEETAEDVVTVTYTRYVLQGLRVLATGTSVRPDPDAPPTVDASGEATTAQVQEGEAGSGGNATVFTLEVTPDVAERLVFAQQAGALYYTLVPPDFVEVDTLGVTIENLFEGDLVVDIFGN
ncbi:MAG TPA: Flp pilus assembly protein CpaB [Acidimicrobiia bacterium]|nr:Flp pilus assembly protein CpaB [Acidimicrobiia bacterium]